MSERPITLYVLAHQDDEYGCTAQIAQDAAAGRRAVVVFLTDGSTPSLAGAVRTAESVAVLRELDVDPGDVHVVGAPLGIAGDALPARLDDAYRALLDLARALSPVAPLRIYAPAWEGGHPDHDAAHLAAARLARELGVTELYEVALYNGYRRPGPFFRVFSFCDGAHVDADAGRRLSAAEVVRYGLLCWRYPSQRRTWAGLFGGAFARLALRRRHAIRRVPSDRPRLRPHPGPLYYERRWGLSYEGFTALVEGFQRGSIS